MSDERDVITAVRAAGAEPTPASRDAMRAALMAEIHGEARALPDRPSTGRARRPWLAVTLIGTAAAAAALLTLAVVTREEAGRLTPATVPQVTVPAPAPGSTEPTLVPTAPSDPLTGSPTGSPAPGSAEPTLVPTAPSLPLTGSPTGSPLLEALVGHRWIAAERDEQPWPLAYVPYVEFGPASTAPFITGNDGCNWYSLAGSLNEDRLELDNGESTAMDCGPGTGGVLPQDGDRLVMSGDGATLELRDGQRPRLAFTQLDRLSAADPATMYGRWRLDPDSGSTLVFRDDFLTVGTCALGWTLTDHLAASGFPDDPYSCVADSQDQTLGRVVEMLVGGPIATHRTGNGDVVYLSNDQFVVRLTENLYVADPAAITLEAGAVFGYTPAQPVTADDVLAHVETQIGRVDHDTGWYSVPVRDFDDGTSDCLGGVDYRVLWWGDLSIAFSRSTAAAGGETLWAWSIGDRRVSTWDDRREIYDPPADARSGLLTETGIGIGTPEQAVIDTYGERLRPWDFPISDPDDGTQLYDSGGSDWPSFDTSAGTYGVSITVRDGAVTGIGASMRFC